MGIIGPPSAGGGLIVGKLVAPNTEYKTGEELEPSATEPVAVYLRVKMKGTVAGTIEITVGGEVIYTDSIKVATAANEPIFNFLVPAGAKYKVVASVEIEKMFRTYQLL